MMRLKYREDGKVNERCDGTQQFPHDPVRQLQIYLDQISRSYRPSHFEVTLSDVLLTKPALALLVQLLNQPFKKSSSATASTPTTTTGDKTTKWESVAFTKCRLALSDPTVCQSLEDMEAYCSPDDIQIFGSAVALQTKYLYLIESPDILHALYDAPKLEISNWNIHDSEFSALDCTRFANVLQRSVGPPVDLSCRTQFIEDPLVLAGGLVNVRGLSIARNHKNSQSARPNYPSMGSMLVGEGGDSLIQRLLQSPFSRLKYLFLANVQLDDRLFMAIVDMLPTSQLEELNLKSHNISWRGIMALARQLPQITCLKTIEIGESGGEGCLKEHHEECCMALTQGMRDNYSIKHMYMDILVTEKTDCFLYYADLNHAGRHILAAFNPIPDGLWPQILYRAGNRYFRRWSRQKNEARRRLETLYFLVRNCQALVNKY